MTAAAERNLSALMSVTSADLHDAELLLDFVELSSSVHASGLAYGEWLGAMQVLLDSPSSYLEATTAPWPGLLLPDLLARMRRIAKSLPDLPVPALVSLPPPILVCSLPLSLAPQAGLGDVGVVLGAPPAAGPCGLGEGVLLADSVLISGRLATGDTPVLGGGVAASTGGDVAPPSAVGVTLDPHRLWELDDCRHIPIYDLVPSQYGDSACGSDPDDEGAWDPADPPGPGSASPQPGPCPLAPVLTSRPGPPALPPHAGGA